MAYKRIATEGNTTDGRNITRDWLTDIAETYDPQKYGARIWMEHMRGLFADGPFPALGDVRAVKVKENAEGKLELYADLDPTDQLKEMNDKRQKVYSSMELDNDFAGTGRTYLTGVAVTDTPASLGTEMLQFSAQQAQNGGQSPLSGRKQKPDNMFSAAIEIDADFTADDTTFDDGSKGIGTEKPEGPSLADKLRAMFRRSTESARQGDETLRNEVEQGLTLLGEQITKINDKLDALPSADDFSQVKNTADKAFGILDRQPDQPARTPPTGKGGDFEQTDC